MCSAWAAMSRSGSHAEHKASSQRSHEAQAQEKLTQIEAMAAQAEKRLAQIEATVTQADKVLLSVLNRGNSFDDRPTLYQIEAAAWALRKAVWDSLNEAPAMQLDEGQAAA